ncbi:MAG TPA: arylsulfatase, partial [Mariniphaga anaerophila]|nr:arylsulfatase [Mariniphaga anaerophila]
FYGIPYSNDMWPYHPRGPGAYPELPLFENETIVNDAVTPDDQKQFTTEFTERTIAFIKKNRENPFFVYLAHPMPHVPLYVSEKFEGKSEQGLYGDVMMELDWSAGQVIQTLKETGLEENTLVIFTSDNGPWLNYGNHAGTTGGLREGKGTSFEGGQRVPCLMYWKGTISPGTVNNALISSIDFLPTLAEIAEAPLPGNKIDGISILPLIKGEDVEPPRKSFWYYYRRNSLEAVQDGHWKLVFPHPGRSYVGFEPGNDGQPGRVNENFPHEGGLYDLRRDPGEQYNLMEFYPEIVNKLEQIASEAREDLGDDLTGNPGKNRREPGRTE